MWWSNYLPESFVLVSAAVGGLVLVGPVSAYAQAFERYCSRPDAPISDLNTTTDTIVIPTSTGSIFDLDVEIDISHTWVGDLNISLTHVPPLGGMTTVLINQPGVPADTYGCGEDNILATIDDEATMAVETMCGTPGPEAIAGPAIGGDLSVYDGSDGGGTWLLSVSDRFQLDQGFLNQWCLNLTLTDNQPPNCDAAAPSVTSLWPPNHRFQDVDIVGVWDPDGDDDSIVITIDGIYQNEVVDGGDGSLGPDGEGVGTSYASLRAERAGGGNGRMYLVSYTADDGAGGTCSGTVYVGVPKSRGKYGSPVDDGAHYDSTSTAF